jgi:hypothetical protein
VTRNARNHLFDPRMQGFLRPLPDCFAQHLDGARTPAPVEPGDVGRYLTAT